MASHQLKITCRNHTLHVNPDPLHMSPGDTVHLEAVGTDATITFLGLSPFVSGDRVIKVTPATPINETVADLPSAPPPIHFYYTVASDNPRCGSLAQGPEMIVP